MARVRVRQHVNPLSQKYQKKLILPDWEKIYRDRTQPLHLDIGCARGRFLLNIAQEQPHWNFLGLEIRDPLVEEANRLRDELDLTNLHYLFSNVNVDLNILFPSLPAKIVQWVSIQFPDPWFKKRHAKRRTVQPELIATLAQHLSPGAKLFLQSDVKWLAQEMRDRVNAHPAFTPSHSQLWLPENPLPVPTEREIATQNNQEPVYRCLFVRQ
ncbi:MAG: tRNA (guanosine(46)-N7)-methyltransferase TrmB [Jaaginema sp. PMC 1079.18]|nr:tRNA (guanosine(46)-N7)-methyltransferase TrmB [Jaaginema sp. PMC 1080.18]MEC4849507.1 tRNA (guanosine(46)-N7)-methyltransferase TrmB [Jaaginema sp. PMC 1079.18]MEC4865614.1 tRNA (guanosine(46)-N7)-methyltransferase TrmB [Jaaginema sp. PMC 1078.18]